MCIRDSQNVADHSDEMIAAMGRLTRRRWVRHLDKLSAQFQKECENRVAGQLSLPRMLGVESPPNALDLRLAGRYRRNYDLMMTKKELGSPLCNGAQGIVVGGPLRNGAQGLELTKRGVIMVGGPLRNGAQWLVKIFGLYLPHLGR